MSGDMRQVIHQMDLRLDELEDRFLLILGSGIRERLMDMLAEHADCPISDEWKEDCFRLLDKSFQESPEREKIMLFLKLSGEPGELKLHHINSDDTEKLRRLCEQQRNRLYFCRSMKTLRDEIIQKLPEADRMEEEQVAAVREMILEEQFDDLLLLYRKAAAMRQNRQRSDRFRLDLKEEIPPDERDVLVNHLVRIKTYREYLEQEQKKMESFFAQRRIIGQFPGYMNCKETERGMETDANRRDQTEKEERGDSEGNQEPPVLQSAGPQYGERREKNAPGCASYETEGG